jgi:hypothetical protein
MAVLSAPFDVGIKDGWETRVLMATGVKIYQGAAVGVVIGAGLATPLLVATAGMKFIGVAEETVDNTVTDSNGTAGAKWIRVRIRGLAAFNLSGLTVANVGANVYFVSGSDDNTVSATVTAICAGELKTIDSDGLAWVQLNTTGSATAVLSSATVTAVTAAGTNLATAGALVAGINIVGGADSTKGVALPATPAAGTCVIVKSTVAGQTLPVYPDAAATINAIGSHAAITMGALTIAIFVAASPTQWYTIPLLPS